jgi:hypothetical protein
MSLDLPEQLNLSRKFHKDDNSYESPLLSGRLLNPWLSSKSQTDAPSTKKEYYFTHISILPALTIPSQDPISAHS